MTGAGLHVASHAEWKLPLHFQTWIERMKTPAIFAEAILALFRAAPVEVKNYYQIEEHGSFVPDAFLVDASLMGNMHDARILPKAVGIETHLAGGPGSGIAVSDE